MEPNIPVGSAAGVERGMDGRWPAPSASSRRGQRQMGGSLEDGAHRPAGVGEGRRRTTRRARVPALDVHRRPMPHGAHAARAGAAHRSRRARFDQRGDAVRQRVRPGHAGGRAQAGRLLRQRRCALSDGGHGDRRDPPEHPLGMAAQGAAAHGGRRGRRATGDPVYTRTLFKRLLAEEYSKLAAADNRDVHDDSKATTLPIAREIVQTYVSIPGSCPGTLTC